MKTCLVGLLFLLPVGLTSESAAQTSEVAAIRELQARQEGAWNRHDAEAYADLFTEDGDVVNVLGWWWRGRAEIKSKLRGALRSFSEKARRR